MRIELQSLVVFGRHGYLEEERRLGQRFLVDLWVDVRGSASDTDRIEDTVDYRRLAELVREVFSIRSVSDADPRTSTQRSTRKRCPRRRSSSR